MNTTSLDSKFRWVSSISLFRETFELPEFFGVYTIFTNDELDRWLVPISRISVKWGSVRQFKDLSSLPDKWLHLKEALLAGEAGDLDTVDLFLMSYEDSD